MEDEESEMSSVYNVPPARKRAKRCPTEDGKRRKKGDENGQVKEKTKVRHARTQPGIRMADWR